MNNFGSRHLFSCVFSVTDPRQGLNKIGYKDLDLLKRDNVNSTAALISRNGRLLNKQRDKAMFAWLHTLAKKEGTLPRYTEDVLKVSAKEKPLFHPYPWI